MPQPDYSFRLRFHLPQHESLGIKEPNVAVVEDESGPSVKLAASGSEKTIADARRLILISSGWLSEDEARTAGEVYQDVLMRTLARLSIGADLGFRASRSVVTADGLAMLENAAGSTATNDMEGVHFLNDFHGLMVYESDPQLRVARTSVSVIRTTGRDFRATFEQADRIREKMSDRERVSFSLFSDSFFAQTADTRLITLMMAVEVLLEQNPRPPESVAHVEVLIKLTREERKLSDGERDSILGLLSWLPKESIRQAGLRLARTVLAGREYYDRTATDLFDHCYTLRSNLVHGVIPVPSRADVNLAAAHLQVFVADLLAGSLRDWDT